MSKVRMEPLVLEDVRLIYRNFEGRASRYNVAGIRSFGVVIEDKELAKKLKAEGWNIKYRENRRDPDGGDEAWLSVKVQFSRYPPEIWIIGKKNRTLLTEEEVKKADNYEILDAKIVINPSIWEVQGETGVKAYLKSLYLTIVEDPFADRFSEIPIK